MENRETQPVYEAGSKLTGSVSASDYKVRGSARFVEERALTAGAASWPSSYRFLLTLNAPLRTTVLRALRDVLRDLTGRGSL